VANISIESKRASKEIGSSLEANLLIKLDKKIVDEIKDIDLSELCITSDAKIIENNSDEISVEAIKAEGKKCSVCWKISKEPCKRHSV